MARKKKVPRRPAPDPDVGKEVWMSCRAKDSCKGNYAKIVMKFKLPAGGRSIRYRCLACNGVFHIAV